MEYAKIAAESYPQMYSRMLSGTEIFLYRDSFSLGHTL
jgi:hypothetical protein